MDTEYPNIIMNKYFRVRTMTVMIVHVCGVTFYVRVVLTFSGSAHRACCFPSLLASFSTIFSVLVQLFSISFAERFLLFSPFLICEILLDIISSFSV